MVKKFSRAEPLKPKNVIKRSYKNFIIEDFLVDVANSDIDKEVTACDNVEDAATVFEQAFKTILDKHAPIRTFQMRKNYAPHVSETTKLLRKARR